VGVKFGDLGSIGREALRAVTHGLAQGAISAAFGGKFGAGFLAAGFSSAAGSFSPRFGGGGDLGKVLRVVRAAAIGGTASVLGGGKFGNGATTAAFVQAFNHDGESHGETRDANRAENSGDSYLVSRPLGEDSALLSHNFIVTDAQFIGDPGANVISFGETAAGTVGRVDEYTEGFSKGTHAADIAAWKELRGAASNNSNVLRIPASSPKVQSVASALIENRDYSALSGPFGANSNSAAQAVANRAAGHALSVPGSPRLAPGVGSWREIQFRGR
jgi:hypothetical protein